jgi:hypothetical protein
MLSLVVGNGVAKLPDQVLPLLFSHRWFQSIDNPDVSGFGLIVPFRGLRDQFLHSLQVITKLFCFLLVLISATRIAASFGPFAHGRPAGADGFGSPHHCYNQELRP